MMQQHEVDIPDVELAQALLDGRFGVGILIGIEFGRHENLLARHTRLTDTLSHLLFVAIDGCRVNLRKPAAMAVFTELMQVAPCRL